MWLATEGRISASISLPLSSPGSTAATRSRAWPPFMSGAWNWSPANACGPSPISRAGASASEESVQVTTCSRWSRRRISASDPVKDITWVVSESPMPAELSPRKAGRRCGPHHSSASCSTARSCPCKQHARLSWSQYFCCILSAIATSCASIRLRPSVWYGLSEGG